MLGRPEKKKRRGGGRGDKGERKRKRMVGREGRDRANISYTFYTTSLLPNWKVLLYSPAGKFTCDRRKNIYRGPSARI